MSESYHNGVNGQELSHWSRQFTVLRFDGIKKRDTRTPKTLYDFLQAVKVDTAAKRLARETGRKDAFSFPAWSLCNDTGDGNGARNGLMVIDLDGLNKNPMSWSEGEALKADLIKYPGILVAGHTLRGNIFAIIHAPNEELGVYASRQIGDYLKSLGHRFEYDPSAERSCQLRLESYDPDLYVSDCLYTIAPDYDASLTNTQAIEAFKLFNNGFDIERGEYEQAVSAIYAASLCAKLKVGYSIYNYDAEFQAGCDIQIVDESGAAKTHGRIRPFEAICERFGVRLPAGIRTTDASLMDSIIDAGCDIVRADDEKISSIKIKSIPLKMAVMIDESGDQGKAAGKDANKSLQNIIRRECFDGRVNIGATAEMQKKYNGKLPSTIPCDISFYSVCTENQFKGRDFSDMVLGGNGRRIIFAKGKTRKHNFLAIDDLKDKSSRLLSPNCMRDLMDLCSVIHDLYGKETTFRFCSDRSGMCARQAAKIAFELYRINENYADTIIYNTAALLSVLRSSVEYWQAMNMEFDSPKPSKPSPVITAQDIECATAIAINSFSVVAGLSAQSIEGKLANARTASEKTQLIIDYIDARKNGIKRDNLIRKFGGDVIKIVDGLCESGVLTYEKRVNQDGKNPHYYYALTQDGYQDKAAAEFRQFVESKKPKQTTQTTHTTQMDITRRLDLYLEKVRPDLPDGRDNALRCLAGKVKSNRDFADNPIECKQWFDGIVKSPEFDVDPARPYTQRDADRLWRDNGLTHVA